MTPVESGETMSLSKSGRFSPDLWKAAVKTAPTKSTKSAYADWY
jgi:hypothetical protein